MLIKLTSVDFAQPLEPIYVDARYDRLFVVVSWGYLPLGMLRLSCPADGHSFIVEQLQHEIFQVFAWQLWEQAVAGTLDELNKQVDRSLPAISVVVPTRDRPLSLERCLSALAKLDYPNYEVVVIDNCSRDPSVVEVIANSGYRSAREETPGLDWARNRGIKEAKHDIIAYVDDDALVAAGWLRGIARGFKDPEVMIVTGMVLPAEIETQAQDDFERYGGMSKGFVGRTIRRDELSDRALYWSSNWGVGANMAFRRALFEAIGDFDVALDVGTPTRGAGDIELFHRAVAAGHVLRYEPAAMVRHVHRRDDGALKRQVYDNGRSFASYLLTVARKQPRRRAALLRFALRWWLWDWLLRRLWASIIKRDRQAFRLALTELRGCCSAPRAYRRSQKVAWDHLKARQ